MGTARNLRRWAILSPLLFWFGSVAYGQINTAEISGQITDPSGAVIPRASVEAVEGGTGLKVYDRIGCLGRVLFCAACGG